MTKLVIPHFFTLTIKLFFPQVPQTEAIMKCVIFFFADMEIDAPAVLNGVEEVDVAEDDHDIVEPVDVTDESEWINQVWIFRFSFA